MPADKPTRNRLCFCERRVNEQKVIDVLPPLAQAYEVSERRRTAILQVRLTDDEKAMLDLIVESSGLNASDWIRQAIRRTAEKLKK